MVSWKQLLKRCILILVLSFVLYALVTLLYIVLSPVARPSILLQPTRLEPVFRPQSDRTDNWLVNDWHNKLAAPPMPLTRTVTISASVPSLALEAELWITPTHPIAREIQNGVLESTRSRVAFLQAAFGRIRIDGFELVETDLALPRWTIDNGVMHLKLGAAKQSKFEMSLVEIERYFPNAIAPATDRITAKLNGVILNSSSLQPQASSETTVVFTTLDPSQGLLLSFLPLAAREGRAPQTTERVLETRQNFLRRLGDLINIPLLSDLLFGVVEAFPLLVFLYLVRKRDETIPPFARYLSSAVASLLLFHFIHYYFAGCFNWTYTWAVFEGLANVLRQYVPMPFSVQLYYVRNAPFLVTPVILGILVPMLLLQRTGYFTLKRKSTLGCWWLPVILFLLGILGASVYGYVNELMPLEDVPLIVWLGLATLIIVCLVWLILYTLYRQVSENPPEPTLLWLATLILPLNAILTNLDRTWREPVWLVFSVLWGLLLLFSLTNVIRQLLRQSALTLTVSPVKRLGLTVLAVMLVVPMASIVGFSSGWANDTDVVYLAYRLDDWIPFVWLGGLLWLLYSAGKNGQALDAFTRTIGILGASMLFFDPLSRWFFIPITFLLGWWTLNRFVYPTAHWQKLAPLFQRVFSQRLDLLDQILDLNNAENAYQQFRKKLSTKLANGEDKLTFAQYDEQLEARKRELEQLRDKTSIEGKSVREVALTFSRYPSAWENGVYGAKMALLFATPWLILYLQDFLTSSTPQATYVLWGFARDWLLVIAKWTVFGFFFGYFYPYLRGSNGLQKGLGLFLVTVLPYLPLMVLYTASSADWQARFFWILQVFIQCMLLGLVAFDYAILRQGHYDWQMLFEVHGMTGVGVSVSSILVAVGAAATTLLTSQATNLVSLALKFILPQVPNIPIPPPK